MNDHIAKPVEPDELFDVFCAGSRTGRTSGGRRARVPAAPRLKRGPTSTGGSTRSRAWMSPTGFGASWGDTTPTWDSYGALPQTCRCDRGIRAALADGRHADAERAAHTLKSVAGTIGARQFQLEAGELEAALRRGLTAGLDTLIQPAEQSLHDLVSALLAGLPPDARLSSSDPTVVDRDALRAAVERLGALLSEGAMELIDAFEAAAPMLAAAFGSRADAIKGLVSDYCFEDALAALREAARGSLE